jgi:electron-transferring-flavoprotein dehydrogenase
MTRPSEFAPTLPAGNFIATPSDALDERIEVGICIVGGGPAGLAAAIRIGQLLRDRPELAESLGEIPVAVIEKGKSTGSHLLSGAVVNPRVFRQLFPGMLAAEMPFIQPVEAEAVYYLTRKRALRIPTPPSMMNHGNYVASVSEIGRWLAEKAEELGVMIVPETAADKLLVSGGRVVGVRTGDKGRDRDGGELGNFEPGGDIVAKATILAEGTLGHLSMAAVERFSLRQDPQVWALGVKEVWDVPKPLPHIVHTMGWPLRGGRKYREFGGSFIYPMGPDKLAVGLVVGLDHRDATVSVHDMLQELKTHSLVRGMLEGGSRVAWGAKTIPEGGLQAVPEKLHFPGGVITGDAAGLVNVPALKGIHYAMRSGMLAAETTLAAVQPGQTAWSPGALAGYDEALKSDFVWKELKRVRNMRPAFRNGLMAGAAVSGLATASLGAMPPSSAKLEADADSEMFIGKRDRTYPEPDGNLTFDKLSSVYLSGNESRDDAPSHIHVRQQVPRVVAEAWVNMCPAQVYEIASGGASAENVEVEVTPSNCVQCGAINAKGGRLTPPEGGDGPDYKLG